MANCTECKYEDFFLSAWAVGDPAQIVDVPANTTDANGNLIKGAKATKVLFPDDPSNVHHSYINDHVKMRVVHAGPKEHHIHHLHAHQWLNTPDSDNSSYLDSQAMGPGYSFTTEIAHGGSGNANKTPGDSIFHCHFYPHFAQGMWELWRSRLDLPLPLLPALRTRYVGTVALARCFRSRHTARRRWPSGHRRPRTA
jgi:hypothetical protein